MWTQVVLIMGTIIAFFVLKDWLERQKLKNFANSTSEQLRAVFDDPSSETLYLKAAMELDSRGVDLTFTFPHFLDMCLSGNMAVQLFGWSGLQRFFRDRVGSVDLSKPRPSQEDVSILSGIRTSLKAKTGL